MKKIILAGFVASLAFSGVALAQTTTFPARSKPTSFSKPAHP
ncbi:hypothetical protein SAMN05216459_101672 [Ensifer sp. OV372]|nr:hypothetical protein SAMN05216459_101672 [Ensifer sp. OV372]